MVLTRCFLMSVCRWWKRTEQDGGGCHHATAQGENDTAGNVRAVGGFNGDIEIECIEEPSCTQKRSQHWEECKNSAALTASRPAAATATLSSIWSLLWGLASLSLALWGPHGQLHAFRRWAYQRSTLVHRGVQIGRFWTPSRRVCAVGKPSLWAWGWRADAVFRGGVQIVCCDDRTGKRLIQLPLLCLICSRRFFEADDGLLEARSSACWNQSMF